MHMKQATGREIGREKSKEEEQRDRDGRNFNVLLDHQTPPQHEEKESS